MEQDLGLNPIPHGMCNVLNFKGDNIDQTAFEALCGLIMSHAWNVDHYILKGVHQ